MKRETLMVAKSLVNLEAGQASKVDKEVIADYFNLIPDYDVEKTKHILPWSLILSHNKYEREMRAKIGEWIFSQNPIMKDSAKYRMNYLSYMISNGHHFPTSVIKDILKRKVEDEFEMLITYEYFDFSSYAMGYLSSCENCGKPVRFDLISKNPNLNNYILSELSDRLDWTLISRYHNLDSDFIFRNRLWLDWDEIKKRVDEN